MTDYVNVSRSAVTLASGQPLAPGEKGEPDFDTDHDKGLRADGALVRVVAENDYEGRGVGDLTAEAESRGVTVEGTGANGNVLKDDLVKALQADDDKETR